MKQAIVFPAVILMLLCAFSVSLSAQKTATWKGGKPGHATEWTCAANWKEGKVPDAFYQVIIPAGQAFYPVITTDVEAIDALLLEGAAVLTLKKEARLTILNETGFLGGLTLLGNLKNNGVLEVTNENIEDVAAMASAKQ